MQKRVNFRASPRPKSSPRPQLVLPVEKRLIVFDFDNTLTTAHVSNFFARHSEGLLYNREFFIDNFFGGISRYTAMVDQLTKCMTLGKVVVCSKGIASEITYVWQLLQLPPEITIYARQSASMNPYSYKKADVIRSLITDEHYTQVVYFDDSEIDHVELVGQKGEDVCCYMGLVFRHSRLDEGLSYYYHKNSSTGLDFSTLRPLDPP